MATDTTQYFGQAQPTTFGGDYNKQRFLIWQQMMNLNTSLPVQVMAVHGGGVGIVGFVDVQILVDQLTGDGKTIDHGVISNVPYIRLQGGANAVIIDPQPGDIGLASFCSRDISAVKNARAKAPPGSERAYNFSDCCYIGGMLNATPTQYLEFAAGAVNVHGPTAVNVGLTTATVRKLIDERILAWLSNHVHTSSTPGTPTSVPTTTIPPCNTEITKAN